MIYHAEPEGFSKKFEVSSIFLEHDGTILLLHRHDHKPQGNTWSLPAGKLEVGEKPEDAIVRELKEETGIDISKEGLRNIRSLYVRFGEYDFVYHMFAHTIPGDIKPEVYLEPDAHKAFLWTTPEEALQMNLIQDEDMCIKLAYNIT